MLPDRRWASLFGASLLGFSRKMPADRSVVALSDSSPATSSLRPQLVFFTDRLLLRPESCIPARRK